MKHLSFLSLLVFMLAGSADATTVVLDSSNSPFYLGGSGLDPNNKASIIYDMREGAELVVTNSAGAQRIWCGIVATNGTAALRRGETSGSLDYRGVLIVSGEGKLNVEGYDLVKLGTDTSGGGYFGDAYCDARNLDFATSGEFNIYCGMIKSVPQGANLTLTWTEDCNCAIPRESQWSNSDTFTFPSDKVNFYLAETNSLKPGCVVTVPAGRVFGITPAYQSGSLNPYEYDIDASIGSVSLVFDCSVTLGTESTFGISGYRSITCTGAISGAGGMRIAQERTSTAYLNYRFLGQNTFTGSVELNTQYSHLYLGGSSHPEREYRLTGFNTYLHFLAAAEGGSDKVTIGSFEGSYWGSYLCATTGQCVTVKCARNKLTANPVSTNANTKIDFSPATGPATVRCVNGFDSNICVNGLPVSSGSVDAFLSTTVGGYAFLLPGSDGSMDWSNHIPSVNAPWYRLSGTQTVNNVSDKRPIKVKGSGKLALTTSPLDEPANVLLESGATLNLSISTEWKKTAALWLDPNSSQIYLPGELVPPAWSNMVLNSGGAIPNWIRYYNGNASTPYIEGMADCRGEGYEYYMGFNDRNYDNLKNNPPRMENLANYSVHAHLNTRADGKKFIDCSSGRLPVHRGGPTNLVYNNAAQETILNPTLAIMVFGSQQGGGSAVIGTTNGDFARTAGSAENPIVNASLGDRKVWVDGVEVDPTKTGLNGGWQIVSVELTGLTVNGFGWKKRREASMGQQYGDIVVFTNEVTDVTRRVVERELSQRWNIATYQGVEPTVSSALSGTGNATISSDVSVSVSGRFCGKATVAAGTTIEIPAALPWSESEVEATEPATWFDPTVRSTVSTLTDLDYSDKTRRPDEILAFWDRRYGFKAVNHHYLFGNGYRTPAYVTSTRGIGLTMAWVDYNNIYEATKNDVSNGNTLRFREWTTESTSIGTPDVNAPVGSKTVFIVQDSCRGGSTPTMSDVSGGGTEMPKRENYSTSAMISSKAHADIRNGDVRLNGETVATPTSTGFTGEPEVFSFSTVNDHSYPATFFAYYGDSEVWSNQKGAIQGEILLYDKYLDPEVRTNVEQYLVGKWVGYLPSGKTDWRAAEIDGAGTVKAASLAVAPKLASTFSGTLVAGGETANLDFTIDKDGNVTGAANCPGATYDLPSSVTLTVNVPNKFPVGEYELLVCKGLANPVNWTLNIQGTTRRSCGLTTVTGDGSYRVILSAQSSGMVLLMQ